MKTVDHNLDHIVLAVPDFEKTIHELSEKLGVFPSIGGRHLTRGTKNALLHIGHKCYLEILAVDHENNTFSGPRWMGVDLITKPTITRWALQTNIIDTKSKYLNEHNPKLGNIVDGERKTPEGETLRWKMTLPQPEPEVDIIPFYLDWSSSDIHPTDRLEKGCFLQKITFYSPHSDKEKQVLEDLSLNMDINQAEVSKILISIKGKYGIIEL